VRLYRDHTGARRFWPLKTQEIDLELIARIREQCFAEAVERFRAGETWHEVPSELAKAQQEARRQTDEWEHLIRDFLDGKASGSGSMFPRESVTIHEIAAYLGFDKSKEDRSIQMRIAKILKLLSWKKKQVWGEGGRPYVWYRPDSFEGWAKGV
jgi:predicted P-loop ATPase